MPKTSCCSAAMGCWTKRVLHDLRPHALSPAALVAPKDPPE